MKAELNTRPPVCSVYGLRQDGVPIVAVTGEVDIATAPLLRAELMTQLAQSPVALVVDLREVTFFDSSGIGALLTAHRQASDLRVVADKTPVLRTLHFSGMDTVFRVHPTLTEALAGLAR
ncbi:STAS domain-containing protein [Lentzea sp. BCCO 10_0061]|uniref:Anti-sigma factor antagonist n=1 Tax=Lentzea sokolovensis TaxID=3095429 RepID=A0ABU4V6A0_9PSEU|nr:STAS domain-containing protein [Lentzea sp. BCCO 10_0061]MDX8147323.1 STAS domain-containing protein [Lentzea sp. BCCO 10_0061]